MFDYDMLLNVIYSYRRGSVASSRKPPAEPLQGLVVGDDLLDELLEATGAEGYLVAH